jgi:hypothetical protein
MTMLTKTQMREKRAKERKKNKGKKVREPSQAQVGREYYAKKFIEVGNHEGQWYPVYGLAGDDERPGRRHGFARRLAKMPKPLPGWFQFKVIATWVAGRYFEKYEDFINVNARELGIP